MQHRILLLACSTPSPPPPELLPPAPRPPSFVQEDVALDERVGAPMDVAPLDGGWVVLGRDGRQLLDASFAPGAVLPRVRRFDGPAFNRGRRGRLTHNREYTRDLYQQPGVGLRLVRNAE